MTGIEGAGQTQPDPADHPVNATDGAALTFIGTATTLLRLGEFTLLTDPNFLHRGQRAYLGYGRWTRRRTEPALGVEDLPPLDAVVLSHLHGDHFDRVAKRRLSRTVPIVTTPQAERRLRRWGFSAEGLATWSSVQLQHAEETLRISAVPARHGPKGVHRLLPPTMGSVIDVEQAGQRRLRLYVTGDTLPYSGLRETAERYPDIDAMLIHLGGTRIAGLLLTMNGRQGASVVDLIRPAMALPIHYDDYPVFKSPVSEFARVLQDHGMAQRLQMWTRGDTITVPYRDIKS